MATTERISAQEARALFAAKKLGAIPAPQTNAKPAPAPTPPPQAQKRTRATPAPKNTIVESPVRFHQSSTGQSGLLTMRVTGLTPELLEQLTEYLKNDLNAKEYA